MFRYAQIDETGLVVSDSWLSGEVEAPSMIPVADDFELGGKKYDIEIGEWVELPVEPVEPEPTQLDRIEESVNTLVGNESALDVLLGVE